MESKGVQALRRVAEEAELQEIADLKGRVVALEAKLKKAYDRANDVFTHGMHARHRLFAISKAFEAREALRDGCESEPESLLRESIEALLSTCKTHVESMMAPETTLEFEDAPEPCPHGFLDCAKCAEEVDEEIEEDDEEPASPCTCNADRTNIGNCAAHWKNTKKESAHV